jgi:hypothetical protein
MLHDEICYVSFLSIALLFYSQKLFKKIRNGYNFGYIQARELHLVSFCAYWSSPYDLEKKRKLGAFQTYSKRFSEFLIKKLLNFVILSMMVSYII